MSDNLGNKLEANEIEKPVLPEDSFPQESDTTQRRWTLIIIPFVILALGLAVFFGMRLMNGQFLDGKGSIMLDMGGNGGKFVSSISIDMDPAPELPETESDKHGVFVRRSDNSIFIGTGNIQSAASMGEDGKVNVDVNYDGPVIEVVTTHDTQIYKDVTEIPEPSQLGGETLHLQQVVEPGSLDEITDKKVVSVWGNMQGDRIIARVLLYH